MTLIRQLVPRSEGVLLNIWHRLFRQEATALSAKSIMMRLAFLVESAVRYYHRVVALRVSQLPGKCMYIFE